MSDAKNYSRREFLKFSTTSLLAGSALIPELAKAGGLDESRVIQFGCSILQGLTTNDSTQLTVDVPKYMKVHYRLIDSETGRLMEPYYQKSAVRDHSDWRVDKLGYENLRYPCRYIFQVVTDKGAVIDERFLKTLDLNRRDTRCAILSCMLEFSPSVAPMWESLRRARPDILFFLGDNVYGDLGIRQGPALLWNRYIVTRRTLGYYKWKELVPVIATWDDHDFGSNDSGGRYKHKLDSAETFTAFFAQSPRPGALEAGPGIASVFKAFGHQFVFTDNRSYRRLPSLQGTGFLGDQQMNWITGNLRGEDGPVWIMQGTQTFGANNGKKGESYEWAFEGEFDEWRRLLRGLNVPVAFTSGDIHFSEVMTLGRQFLGFETVELTSSSMHSFWPLSRPKNQRRRQAVWNENYFIIDLKPSDSELVFDVAAQGMMQKVFFKENVVIG